MKIWRPERLTFACQSSYTLAKRCTHSFVLHWVAEARDLVGDALADPNFYVRLRLGAQDERSEVSHGSLAPKFTRDFRLKVRNKGLVAAHASFGPTVSAICTWQVMLCRRGVYEGLGCVESRHCPSLMPSHTVVIIKALHKLSACSYEVLFSPYHVEPGAL